MKVVFHISEEEKWPEATANIHNLLKAVACIDIVVTVNGNAILGYLAEKQPLLANPQVVFHACHNAMKAHGITSQQLPENVTVVPAGVLDLIQLQAAGYAYIKP